MDQTYLFGERITSSLSSFLPNLLAAIAILVVGWLLALLISRLVRAALARTRVDERLVQSLREDSEGPPPNVGDLAAKIVFWILMVVVVLGCLQVLGLAFAASPLSGFLGEVFGFLPNLLSAILLLVIAWLVARVLRFLVQKGARALHLDEKLAEQATPPEHDPALNPDRGPDLEPGVAHRHADGSLVAGDPAVAPTAPSAGADPRRPPALSRTLG